VAFVARDPYVRIGEIVRTGHCLAHCQAVAGVPHSSRLRRGERVRDAGEVPIGTVIGTFDAAGHYTNATDGTAHVALLLERTETGLHVIDQWVGKPVGSRSIHYRGGNGKPVDDGDAYFIVEAV
jgi:hypothetical protein